MTSNHGLQLQRIERQPLVIFKSQEAASRCAGAEDHGCWSSAPAHREAASCDFQKPRSLPPGREALSMISSQDSPALRSCSIVGPSGFPYSLMFRCSYLSTASAGLKRPACEGLGADLEFGGGGSPCRPR